MTRRVSLWVNDTCINLDYFVSGFIDHTVSGMLSALKGGGEVGTLELSVDGGEVNITLNNTQVPVNAFANDIVKNTVSGLVSTLKGVSKINKLRIVIER